MKAGQPLTLDENYRPRRKAIYWWSQFEASEARDEFACLRVSPAACYDTATAPHTHLPDLCQTFLSRGVA